MLRRAFSTPVAVPALVALLFFGAMFWAKARDPFQRIWFKLRPTGLGRTECVAVLPKMRSTPDGQTPQPGGRLPVVIYLHGSGGSLLSSGNELRQMAEMGLAAVGLEYSQTNEAASDAQLNALLAWLPRQPWADTNRIAWVGYSLGTQRWLARALRHHGPPPQLLVCLAGGWVPELDLLNPQRLKSDPPTAPSPSPQPAAPLASDLGPRASDSLSAPLPPILLLHGERDSVFPPSEARRVAARLRSNGVPAQLKVLPGLDHGLGGNRLLVFRAIGEYCLAWFNGPEALSRYSSILSWQARARPLWLFWLPALAWVATWAYLRRRGKARQPGSTPPPPALPAQDGPPPASRRWDAALRWVAGLLAAAALAQSALHLVPPRLAVGDRTLDIARRHLLQPKERTDFEFLAANPVWRGRRLHTLLEHVELAHYNRELINWRLDDPLYRDYVLSPLIEPAADGALNWRRPLWENFYPRIRKEQTTDAAAEVVVRFLRERVTITPHRAFPRTIEEIWRQQITTPQGFETVYVAALRAAGIPARLDPQARAEFWTGSQWQLAPRPVIEEISPVPLMTK